MKPAILIPAYEPDEQLVEVVKTLAPDFDTIVVVNDGSSSTSLPYFREIERFGCVTVIGHARNLGKGAALKTGFNHILMKHPDVTYVITADADGQHLAKDITKVAQASVDNRGSLILGVRQFSGTVPLRSRLGNIATNWIFRILLGKNIRDTQTGLRGIPTDFARELLALTAAKYEFELDMLVKAIRENREIKLVHIETVYLEGNQKSHFNPIRDSLRIYFVFLRFVSSSLAVAGIDLAVFSSCYHFTGQILFSFFIGRTVALAFSLYLSTSFVFKANRSVTEFIPSFLLLWVTLFVGSFSLMILFVDYFSLPVLAAKIIVDIGLFASNFIVQRMLIFRPQNPCLE